MSDADRSGPAPDAGQQARDWWRTSIIEMTPGVIRYRGYAIEDLIRRRTGLAEMIWLLTRGELPSRAQAALLEAALMAAVDHGPQAPSIAIARMAATCGVGLNGAMASAVNVLGDVHGGAGEQAVRLYEWIAGRMDAGADLDRAVGDELARWTEEHGQAIPGFGHRFHPVDPRTAPLLERVDEAAAAGAVSGRFARIGRAIEVHLAASKGKPIPMNIDGATAVIYAELGFQAPLARGLFCLSRSVGILAHAWEQTQEGVRIKGPIPRQWTPTYDGPPPRPVAAPDDAGG
jgi:citrate synthase